MKSAPFVLLLLGVAFIWLGLTGRLGTVLAAIFEPAKLEPVGNNGVHQAGTQSLTLGVY